MKENIQKVLSELSSGNNKGERVTLVAATKTVDIGKILQAVSYGITDIGENRVNEFRQKLPHLSGVRRHFIGPLQTNKVKYLIGNVDLIHSVDRTHLAEEISRRSVLKNLSTNILLQINIGNEDTKGGFSLDEAEKAYLEIKNLSGLNIQGFMAMLPYTDDIELIKNLCLQMRGLYDKIKAADENILHLSLGMSGDYKIAIECGSNMVRIGSALLGERDY